MQIENGIYYHVHRKVYAPDKWEIGKIIEFGRDFYNFFFDYYIKVNLKKTDSNIDGSEKIKEYAMLIRELVYEEVRIKYFSDLPSRRHCIWLCDQDSLQLWINTLSGDYEIYKVKATGNIHKCYAGALEDDNINYKLLYEKAIAYWKGECIGSPLEKEYLFEGIIEIIDRL